MNEKLEAKREQLRAVEALLESDGWRNILEPHLKERLAHHTAGCCARNLTPDKRAEHIEAVELATNLLAHPKALIRALECSIAQIKDGKK